MATISSVFRMQDNATKTFNKVADSIGTVIDRADELSNKTSTMGTGVSSINPALTQAISKYQELNSQSDSLAQKSALLQKQERLLVKELHDQRNGYSQNEKAILGIENRLFNVRKNLDQIEKKGTKLTGDIENQAVLINKIANNTKEIRPVQEQISQGFNTWQTKLIMFNQTLQAVKSIAGGVQKVMNFSDSIVLGANRLGMINDGLQTTEELQNKIYAAAQRSRGSYDDMAKSVSKLGMLAGDAFNNNDEMIAFSEMMQKSFKVSGASQQEISSATYQLTQAMASGMLQGDELRSIRENAPMLYQAIAEYTGKSKGELKEMGAEGKITADIIKAAMFSAADDINAQYENMPKTFADMTQSIKNTAQLEFYEVANRISEMLNNEKVVAFMSKIEKAISIVADGALWMVDKIGIAVGWAYEHMDYLLLMLSAVAIYMGVTMVPAILGVVKALFLKAAAWAANHWQILAVLGVLTIGYAIFQSTGSILTTLAWVILIVAGAFAIWNAVQWALNGALYACPIVWIIVAILAVIAIIYLLIQWILKLTDSTNTALGIIMGALFAAGAFIYNLFASLVNFVIDAFVVLWNFIASFGNFFANVFSDPVGAVARLFFDLVDTVLGLLESLASAIDTIFGSNLAKSVSGWRDDLGGWVDDKFGKGVEVMEKLDGSDLHLGRWEYGDAWDSGLQFGNDLSKKIESFDPASALSSIMGDSENAADKYGAYDYGALLDANGNLPVSIEDDKTKGEVDISDEDLKMLKDIATREYMLNYKHVTPNVTIEFGDVRETADVNQVRDAISKMMEEELAELYVVEEA